jgi:hypothetical protein
MIAWSGWKFPFMRIARLQRTVPLEPGVIDEHNRFDIELYDFAESSLKKGVHSSARAISERLATLNSGRGLASFQEVLALGGKDRAIFAEQNHVCDMTLNIGRFAACKNWLFVTSTAHARVDERASVFPCPTKAAQCDLLKNYQRALRWKSASPGAPY